ncbi:MAG: ATP-dependent helicase [bacterium]
MNENILKKLNKEQKEAVFYNEGHFLIIAGAGTGKTNTITYKIAHLINTKQAKPEEILGLTFTEKAASEMQTRVDVLIPYGYSEMTISTFHSFGDKILRENAFEVGLSSEYQTLNQSEQFFFIKQFFFKISCLEKYYSSNNPYQRINSLLKLISQAKDENISPEEYLLYVEKKEKEFEQEKDEEKKLFLKNHIIQQKEIAFFYQNYQKIMAENDKIDFGDQIYLSCKILKEHYLILKNYREKYKYILIDEFQDTNYAQFELIKLLVTSSHKLTVVGDDDQSIYKFRGASLSNILNFKNVYKNAKEIVLTANYRSPQSFLDNAYTLIKNNNPERLEHQNNINKKLISQKSSCEKIKYLPFNSLDEESDAVAKEIQNLVENKKYKYNDIAILVRAHKNAEIFIQSLNMLGIPYQFETQKKFFNQHEIILLISFIKTLSDFNNNISFYSLSRSSIYNITIFTLVNCNSVSKNRHKSLFYIFSHLKEFPEIDISPDDNEKIKKIVKNIEEYNLLLETSSIGQVMYQFIEEFLKNLLQEKTLENEEKMKNIGSFFNIIKRFETLFTSKNIWQFEEYLDGLINFDNRIENSSDILEIDAINISTIHKAKGLEFPVVFMVNLIDDQFPCSAKGENSISLPSDLLKDLPIKSNHISEERRLFYVGMTRATKLLYFTYGPDKSKKRGGNKVSRFICESLNITPVSSTNSKNCVQEIIEKYKEPQSPKINIIKKKYI